MPSDARKPKAKPAEKLRIGFTYNVKRPGNKAVGDGTQALASIPVFAPQVVVLDIGLPGLSGYEVARRIRTMPAMNKALLIAVTGYGQKEDQIRAIDAGFDRHFVKPTDPRVLVELIASWPANKATADKAEAAEESKAG